jgi:hypothetical protein
MNDETSPRQESSAAVVQPGLSAFRKSVQTFVIRHSAFDIGHSRLYAGF